MSFSPANFDSRCDAHDPDRPPVALIAGPTASGKSAVALRLAQQTGGVIVNADASQVYADLAVLTARPDATDLARAPHRLFGHVDGREAYSAARWAEEAKAEIAAAHATGLLPILTGGTGLYLDTLLQGIAPVPDIDLAIRDAIRALPVEATYATLEREDPEAAARLNAGDTARVARALEVVRSTGKPLAYWQQRRVGGIAGSVSIHAGVVTRPKADLARRAERRLDIMLSGGAIEEVQALIVRKLPADRPVLRALGVREIASMLAGEIDIAEARASILKQTLAYQKRQLTWARGRQSSWAALDPEEAVSLDGLARLDDTIET
ncbi:MAG: tRNA (adenosine(37)-N6)-dimethylallyltransferase MiaA [Sphingobium sp.]|nr:tRNA (adenosine(37)-N6)-dimethylallyltransferase MiaA [Sphingobium sp.]